MKRIALIAFVTLAGCRTDRPPILSEICTLDGLGGGDCVKSDGSRIYKAPSEMLNYWATTQEDEANFAAWCYQVPPKTASEAMETLRKGISERN